MCPNRTLVDLLILVKLENEFVTAIIKRRQAKKADIENLTRLVEGSAQSGNSLLCSVPGSKKLDLLVVKEGYLLPSIISIIDGKQTDIELAHTKIPPKAV